LDHPRSSIPIQSFALERGTDRRSSCPPFPFPRLFNRSRIGGRG
jgi:hypothetical protein